MIYDVIVVGAGATGVGVSVALKHAGIENVVILDRHQVGASFAAWPAETRFITPSFPTNSIGMLDLNSVAIGVSPAFSLEVEHPTGQEYAAHLRGVAEFFELPVQTGIVAMRVTKSGEQFIVETQGDTYRGRHLIWAAGEFQYPRLNGFIGSELCRHTATIASYEELDGDDFIITGGWLLNRGFDRLSPPQERKDCSSVYRLDLDGPRNGRRAEHLVTIARPISPLECYRGRSPLTPAMTDPWKPPQCTRLSLDHSSLSLFALQSAVDLQRTLYPSRVWITFRCR
jgi:hypothetical protein